MEFKCKGSCNVFETSCFEGAQKQHGSLRTSGESVHLVWRTEGQLSEWPVPPKWDHN